MKSALDAVRRFVRSQFNQVGRPVTNIWGGTARPSPLPGLVKPQTWLSFSVPGGALIAIDEVYTLWATDDARRVDLLSAIDGVVIVSEPVPAVRVLRGVIVASNALTFTLGVDTESEAAEFAVYVDGTLQRRGASRAEIVLTLGRGPHVVEVVAMAATLMLSVPTTIGVDGAVDVVPKPVWENVSSSYVDPATGVTSVLLEWHADPRVGGWHVLRRQLVSLDEIVDVSQPDRSGVLGVEVMGDRESDAIQGNDLFAGPDLIGVILRASYNADSDTTTIQVRSRSDLVAVPAQWPGRAALTGRFVSITDVRRIAGNGIVRYSDTDVKVGEGYDYALQGYRLFDKNQLGPMSDVRSVRAGDTVPPGPIVPLDGYPSVARKVATVKFHTPVDEDYAGCRVYYKQTFPGTVTAATNGLLVGTVTVTSDLTKVDLTTADWFLEITAGTGIGQRRQIRAIAGSVLDVDPWATLPVGASVDVFSAVPVLTDYGTPDQDDELQFTTIDFGTYVFRAFDRAGNEQLDDDAFQWDYEVDDDLNGVFARIGPVYGSQQNYDRDKLSPDGVLWINTEFTPECESVWIYAAEGPNADVRMPELSDTARAWIVRRQEGKACSDPNWRTMPYIATRRNWFRKILAYAIAFDGQRGPTVTLEGWATRVEAVTATPKDMTDLVVTEDGTTNHLSWTQVGGPLAPSASEDREVLVIRNGIVIARLPSDAESFDGEEIAPEVSYTYEIVGFVEGRTGKRAVDKRASTVASAANPKFVDGTPRPSFVLLNTIEIHWTCAATPLVSVSVERSKLGYTGSFWGTKSIALNSGWTTLVTDTTSPAAGSYNDTTVPKGVSFYYRLRAERGAGLPALYSNVLVGTNP